MMYIFCLLMLFLLNSYTEAADTILFLDASKGALSPCIITRPNNNNEVADDCKAHTRQHYFESGRPIEFVVWKRRLLSHYTVSVDKIDDVGEADVYIRNFEAVQLSQSKHGKRLDDEKLNRELDRFAKRGVEPPDDTMLDEDFRQIVNSLSWGTVHAKLAKQHRKIKGEKGRLIADINDLRNKIKQLLGDNGSSSNEVSSPEITAIKSSVTSLKRTVERFMKKDKYMNEDEVGFRKILGKADILLEGMDKLRAHVTRYNFKRMHASVRLRAENLSDDILNFESRLDILEFTRKENGSKTRLQNGNATANEAGSEEGRDSKLDKLLDEVKKWRSRTTNFNSMVTKQNKYLNDELQQFEDELISVNQLVKTTLKDINKGYKEARISEMTGGQFISLNQNGNLRVRYTIYLEEGFRPYRGLGSSTTGATSEMGVSTPSNGRKVPVYSGQFEIHKFAHAAIVSGFVFSSLEQPSYALRTRHSVADRGINENFATITGRQRPVHIMLGVQYFPWRKDTFPGAIRGFRRWVPGIFTGISVKDGNQYFIGGSIEPSIGMTVGVGLHYGRRQVLDQDIKVGQTLTAITMVPTHYEMGMGVFGMIGFDHHIFLRIFGKVIGVVGGGQ